MRYSQLSRQEPLTIPAGEERNVYFTVADARDDPNEHGLGGFTVLSSAASYTGNVAVWAPAEARLSVLAVQLLADGETTSTSSTAPVFAPHGVGTVPVAGYIVDGRKLFFRIKNHGDASVTVSRVDARFHSVAE